MSPKVTSLEEEEGVDVDGAEWDGAEWDGAEREGGAVKSNCRDQNWASLCLTVA